MEHVVNAVNADLDSSGKQVHLEAHSFGMSVQAALGPKVLDGRGLQGRVLLAFAVTGDGVLSGLRITRSSGHDELDREALRIVGNAVLPIPPTNLNATQRTYVSAFTFT